MKEDMLGRRAGAGRLKEARIVGNAPAPRPPATQPVRSRAAVGKLGERACDVALQGISASSAGW